MSYRIPPKSAVVRRFLQRALERQPRLTARETEVLELVAQCKTNKEIAASLIISDGTVNYHLRNILDKLHPDNRAQVAVYAASRGVGGIRG